MLTNVPNGNYQFLPASATYSGGVIAQPGHAIVRATLRQPLLYVQGFDAAAQHLAGIGRPLAALCAVELRSPRPFSFDGFGTFNQGYTRLMNAHNLLLNGLNPLARTNVVPEGTSLAPPEPALYAFAYTVPLDEGASRPQFVLSGNGELRPGPATRESIVWVGETSSEAMRDKAAYVLDEVTTQLARLGVGWSDATGVNVYAAYPLHDVLTEQIVPLLGVAAIHGVHWFYSRPPIQDMEFELDLRGVARELFV